MFPLPYYRRKDIRKILEQLDDLQEFKLAVMCYNIDKDELVIATKWVGGLYYDGQSIVEVDFDKKIRTETGDIVPICRERKDMMELYSQVVEKYKNVKQYKGVKKIAWGEKEIERWI